MTKTLATSVLALAIAAPANAQVDAEAEARAEAAAYCILYQATSQLEQLPNEDVLQIIRLFGADQQLAQQRVNELWEVLPQGNLARGNIRVWFVQQMRAGCEAAVREYY